jgi:hypothetical protein
VVQLLKSFLKRQKENSGNISIEQYNKEIDEALSEVAAGNYITQEEMEKRAAKSYGLFPHKNN